MVQPPLVREANRVGELANQMKPEAQVKFGTAVLQPMVEPFHVGVVLEDQRRAELGLLVVEDLDDARVLDAFEKLKFATRLPGQGSPGFVVGSSGEVIDPNSSTSPDGGVCSEPVLIVDAFVEQMLQTI